MTTSLTTSFPPTLANRRSSLRLAAVLLAVVAACSGPHRPRTLTIAYSNDLQGEIRSCGCAAKDYGGLGRRATFLNTLRDSTGDFLLLDGGDIFGAGINYGREKADLTLKSMARMGYHAVVVGEKDFGFGTDYIVRRSREIGLPVLAANVFDAAADTLLFPASREVVLGSGLRVGIVGIVSAHTKLPPQVPAGSIEIRDPTTTLLPIVAAMRPRVDLVVVLGHMDRGEAQRMAAGLHGVDVVVHGHEGKAMRQVNRSGEAYVLQVSERGLYMGVAYATLGKDGRIASLDNAVVPLDPSFADDEAIAKLFQAYDLDIAAKEKSVLPTGITNAAELSADRFVGVGTCEPCHAEIVTRWRETKHAHAFETLTARRRDLDRDCTPCHTTGFYKRGGFVSAMATPALEGIQCESCHGNGAAHSRDSKAATGADARSACHECHTVDQSPDFNFDAFWTRIDHGQDPPRARAGPR